MSDVTGGSSTLSSLASSTDAAFNLHDEKSVILLLRKIHQSALQTDQKNDLRDTVFSFRSLPGVTVTPELQAKFTEHGFSLFEEASLSNVANTGQKVHDVNPHMGSTRPKPTFIRENETTNTEEVSTTSTPVPVPKEPVQVVTSPSVSQVSSTPTPIVETPVIEVQKESVASVQEVSTPTITPSVVVPAVSPNLQQAGSSGVSPEKEKASKRIAEIKLIVNKMVGNPVNLIDTHNEVGRDYMNALLDAMKTNSTGTPDKLTQAMQRLESSLVAVSVAVSEVKKEVPSTAMPTIDQKSTKKIPEVKEAAVQTQAATPSSPDVVVSPPTSQKSSSVGEEAPFATRQVAVQSTINKKITPPVASQIRTNNPSISGYEAAYKEREKAFEKKQVVPEVPTATPAAVPEKTSEQSTVSPQKKPIAPIPPVVKVNAVVPSVSIPTSSATPKEPIPSQVPHAVVEEKPVFVSVAKDKQVKDLFNAKKMEEALTDQQKKETEIAEMDPWMTPTVTNGLNQLLSEWTLFKSSGIFGTGPSGMEHVLYKKLAPLLMTEIMAGRFDGATAQIKRSIADYMNGWRYEEGVLHDKNETFEHYLRRVIKHILDKRK